MRELNTYPEYHKFIDENEKIGFWSNKAYPCNQYDIWLCELYHNKTNGKFSILLTADSDEQWSIIEFDQKDI